MVQYEDPVIMITINTWMATFFISGSPFCDRILVAAMQRICCKAHTSWCRPGKPTRLGTSVGSVSYRFLSSVPRKR